MDHRAGVAPVLSLELVIHLDYASCGISPARSLDTDDSRYVLGVVKFGIILNVCVCVFFLSAVGCSHSPIGICT